MCCGLFDGSLLVVCFCFDCRRVLCVVRSVLTCCVLCCLSVGVRCVFCCFVVLGCCFLRFAVSLFVVCCLQVRCLLCVVPFIVACCLLYVVCY